MKDVTKWQLFNALITGGKIGEIDLVQSVEREDGSGHCFNVTGKSVIYGPANQTSATIKIFIRTID